jgi:hypothetical protein
MNKDHIAIYLGKSSERAPSNRQIYGSKTTNEVFDYDAVSYVQYPDPNFVV